jgi:hypothetical protein
MCPVRLNDSTLDFPIIKTTKLLVETPLMYMSKVNLRIELT